MGWTSSFGQIAGFRGRLSQGRPQTGGAKPRVEQLEDRWLPAIIHVGPSQSITTIAQAAAVAQNGDDIQIDAGTYSGQYAVFSQSNLTIEGVGGVAHFDDSGTAISNRKGIFVIDGSNTTVRNIEFSGAHDSAGLDKNWAGIRQEGATLTVDHCYFHNNDDGILTSAGSTSDILIKYSEFAQNGYGDGQSHNMYIGNVRSFTLEYSYTHDAIAGHDVKSRANTNYILYNWIGDTGAGSASYELTMPNGGTAYVIGNVIRQDPDTQNSTIVDWGSEGAINPTQGVFIVNNTIINDRSGGTYVRLNGSGMPVQLVNNIFGGSGGGTVYSGPTATQTANLTVANPGFVNPGAFDYHLTSGSAAINAGTNPGSANGVGLTPTNQYVPVANTETRPVVGPLDIGAYEFGNGVTVPAAPTNLAASAGDGQVALSWSGSTGATSYNVYRWNGSSYALDQNVTGTSFTDTGLSDGTTYYYEVTAVNSAGESGASNQVSATPQAVVTIPAAPANLTASAGDGRVSLNWNASTGATSYNLYRWDGSSYALLQTVGGTSFTNIGLSNGTTYYYQVTAVNSAGESGRSNQASATPQAAASATAAFVTNDSTTQGSWQAVYGADGYDISQGAVKLPAYATVSLSGNANYVWNGATSDPRALQQPGTTSRLAACWYSGSSFTIDVNITDGQAHQVALDALDWDNYGPRQERIDVIDAATGTVLDSRTLTNFSGGQDVVWNIKGHVQFRVTNLVGGSNAVISGIFFGKGAGSDTVWVDDSAPAGATLAADGGDAWNWIGSNPTPISGSLAHTSNIASGEHQHYFYNATGTLSVATGDKLFAYVYLDPTNPPSEIMLQWNVAGSWEHRAYWGANNIGWGADGTVSRQYMGALPSMGGWVRLEVAASAVGLEGAAVNGMAFTLYGGKATWDKAGKASAAAVGPVVGTGTGLAGQYFADQTLSNLVLSRTDTTVNFDWGSGAPAASVPVDHFSARWTGQVQAQFSETYTFYTQSDDGIRLWVNGLQIINNWTDHAPTENSGVLALVAGQKYPIIMEYYENGGGAVAKLLWSSPSTAKQVVPTSQLYAAANQIVLHISEDAWQGDAQYTIAVDGQQVGGVRTATAQHSQGQSETVVLPGPYAPGPHTITITFLNDAYGGTAATDRNLYVDGIDFNGLHYAGTALYSNGTWTLQVG